MANTFYSLIRGSGEVKYSYRESIPPLKKGTACNDQWSIKQSHDLANTNSDLLVFLGDPINIPFHQI